MKTKPIKSNVKIPRRLSRSQMTLFQGLKAHNRSYYGNNANLRTFCPGSGDVPSRKASARRLPAIFGLMSTVPPIPRDEKKEKIVGFWENSIDRHVGNMA